MREIQNALNLISENTPSQDPMSLKSPLPVPYLQLSDAKFIPSSNIKGTFAEEAPSGAGTAVLRRMSAFFQSSTVIGEAEFILSCKKVVALLHLSEPKDVDLAALVDLVEHAVITFIVRVFPFAPKEAGVVPSTLTPGLTAIISLLDLIDVYLDEDRDFSVQLRMEAIRRLLLDHAEISFLLCWSSSSPFIHTSLFEGTHQSTSFDASNLFSMAHSDIQYQSLPELLSNINFPMPSLSPVNDELPSPPSSFLHSFSPLISQATATGFSDFASSFDTPRSDHEGIISPETNFWMQPSPNLDFASQLEQTRTCRTERSLTCLSPLLDPQNLPATSALATHLYNIPSTYATNSPGVIETLDNPQAEARRVQSYLPSPLSSMSYTVLADLSDSNQSNHDVQHKQHQTKSYSSPPSEPCWPPAASVHPTLAKTQLKYVPDDTRSKYTSDNTTNPEMAALIIEKQSVIRRPRRPRSTSNLLQTEGTVPRRTRAQARAASANIPNSPVALSLPLPKPLGLVDSNDVGVAVFSKARKIKKRTAQEAVTTTKSAITEPIHWEADGPRPKPARGPRNRASQTNLKSGINKENVAKVEVDSPTHDEA